MAQRSISCHSEDEERGRRISFLIGVVLTHRDKQGLINTETGFFAALRMTKRSDGILRYAQNDRAFGRDSSLRSE